MKALAMEAAGMVLGEDFAETMLRDSAEKWLESCRTVLRWHRERWLAGIAKDEETGQVVKVMPGILRFSRFMQGQLLDPEWPHKDLAKELETISWQMEEAWNAWRNPMTNKEADAVLEGIFPKHAPHA